MVKKMGWDDEDGKWMLRAVDGTVFCEKLRADPDSWDDWPVDTCALPRALGLLSRLLTKEMTRMGMKPGFDASSVWRLRESDRDLGELVLGVRDFLRKIGY